MGKFIELLKYVLLAFIQGIGEVLPISSSGHLILCRRLLGIVSTGLSIELVLHLASLLALFIYYRNVIFGLIKGTIKYIFYKNELFKNDFIFVRGMIISLIPTCIVGYFFSDFLDKFISYTMFIGCSLILNGINLYLIRNKNNDKKISDLSLFSFVKIGIGQCLGLVPGFSRSGSALSMCYREGLNKEDSKRFTFLMLFPLVMGSVILNFEDFLFSKDTVVLMIISFMLTFIITLFSIEILNKIIKENKIHYFCYYCLILGILVMFV